MPTETEDHLRRCAGYGIVELDKELAYLRRAVPNSSTIPHLERYLGGRRAEAERIYGGKRLEAR